MIHFDFSLEDVDAENLFRIIRSEIDYNNIKIVDAIANGDEQTVLMYRRDNEYIKSLLRKMCNQKIS